jgi:alanine racemase
MYRKTQAIIHLQHLKHNLSVLKGLKNQNGFFCPMVKANAYGHGDVEVSQFLQKQGVQSLGVSLVEEALKLRQNGISADIILFGIASPEDLPLLKKEAITPVVSTWDFFRALAASPIPFHLKFDTGMHRLGFSPNDLSSLKAFLDSHPELPLRGICTHLHSAEDLKNLKEKSSAFDQLQKLKQAKIFLGRPDLMTHSLNSAGLVGLSAVHCEPQGVRPGLAIYGYSSVISSLDLKPVMSLRAPIVEFKQVKKGDGFSYGHTFKVERDSLIGILPIGYADGYHRNLGNKTFALFRGVKVPVKGTVCMDYIMVDLTEAAYGTKIEAGEWVTLFGCDEDGIYLPATELSQAGGTIPWEILTAISYRVPRVFEGAK